MNLPKGEEPKSLLGYHRQLAPSAAVKVSPICLGAMNLGTAWQSFMGAVDKKTTFELLDYFRDQGGNFIDTANNYQDEQSETWIGEWMTERNCRDEMVIATKYTTGWRVHKKDGSIQSNFGGNNAKSLHLSVKDSLKKFQTDYLDVLYVHWWDYTTSIPELMHSLDDLVRAGKVLYLGISDTPAWIVSKANQYARDHGLRQFVVYQGLWSAAQRDFEREIIPMCRAEGMGLAPWGALGGGNFKNEEQRKSDEGRKTRPASEAQITISKVLEKIAKEKGSIITSVAMAYVMHKTPYVFPICGGRKVDHLKGNIEALGLSLSKEEMDEIDNAVPFDRGFPHTFATGRSPDQMHGEINGEDLWLANLYAKFDAVDREAPIPAHKHAKK
ncbi:MAG: hypothetical protein Q9227_002744 [Pyrenula ochraceoflavens]